VTDYLHSVLKQQKNEKYLLVPKWCLTSSDIPGNGIQACDFPVLHWGLYWEYYPETDGPGIFPHQKVM
jgi:hypothetical protein